MDCYWRDASSGPGVAIIVGSLVLDVVPSGVWSCSFSSSDAAAALRREGHGMGRPAPVSPHVVDEWAGLRCRSRVGQNCVMGNGCAAIGGKGCRPDDMPSN